MRHDHCTVCILLTFFQKNPSRKRIYHVVDVVYLYLSGVLTPVSIEALGTEALPFCQTAASIHTCNVITHMVLTQATKVTFLTNATVVQKSVNTQSTVLTRDVMHRALIGWYCTVS